MFKKFFICFVLLNSSSVSAIPECLRRCLPCLSPKRNMTDKNIQRYITVKLNPIFEEQVYKNRAYFDRFLDCLVAKRFRRKAK